MPFDLDAVARETKTAEPFEFIFDGDTYTLPGEPDIVAAQAISHRDFGDALERLLGADQWAAIVSADAVMTRKLALELLEAYTKHVGSSSGESQGSTSS